MDDLLTGAGLVSIAMSRGLLECLVLGLRCETPRRAAPGTTWVSDQGHGLGPAAALAAPAFEAERLEALDQVGDGLFLAGAAGRPAFEFVGSQGLDDARKAVRSIDLRGVRRQGYR